MLFAAPPPPVESWNPADTGALLAEYDFLEGASPTVLYDVSGNGNNGTVGGGTWAADGYVPGALFTDDYAVTPIAGNVARTVLLYMTPPSDAVSYPVWGQTPTPLGANTTHLYADLVGDLTKGRLYPRVRDLQSGAQVLADYSVQSWPFTLGASFGTLAKISLNGINATYYDAQSAGSGFGDSAPICFGCYYYSEAGAAPGVRLHYALIYDRELDDTELLRAHNYIVSRCAGRPFTLHGPATLTGDILVMVGNSYTAMINQSRFGALLDQSFDTFVGGFSGNDPATVLGKFTQAYLPLARPLADRNYMSTQTFPNGDGAAAYTASSSACAAWSAIGGVGTKTVVVNAISSVGNDAQKNIYNGLLDDPVTGWESFADALADWHALAEYGPDGSYVDLTYYNVDQLHPTDFGYETEIEPTQADAINSLG